MAALAPQAFAHETSGRSALRLFSDIETSVAVRSETDSRDPEPQLDGPASAPTSKRAEQQTRSAEESNTWVPSQFPAAALHVIARRSNL